MYTAIHERCSKQSGKNAWIVNQKRQEGNLKINIQEDEGRA
jgi:hypothetical protein